MAESVEAECELDLRVVLRRTETGIGGALVEARAEDHEEVPCAAGTTDATGRVVLALPAGISRIRCWNGAFQGTRTFDLASGERHSAVLEVDPTVVVVGRVLSASGHDPVAGAAVWVDEVGPGATATTDASGTFAFPFLPASGHMQTLHVRALGHCKDSVRITAFPDGSWTSQLPWLAAEGDLPPRAPGPRGSPERTTEEGYPFMDRDDGRRSGSIPPVVVADVVLEPERTIVGRILAVQGGSIEGASVRALGHYAIRPGMAFPDRASALTDRNGRFAIGGLRPDVGYQIECSSMGRATQLVLVPPARVPMDDVGTIVLPAELAIGGRVLDDMGLPVEGVLVSATADAPAAPAEDPTVWPRDPAYVAPVTFEARTDVSGEFDLRGLAPGPYRLTVACDGVVWVQKALDLPTAPGVLELRLPSDAPTLAGRIWYQGAPAADLQVIVRDGAFHRSATSDAAGAFRFVGLARDTTYQITSSTWRPGATAWAEAKVEARIGEDAALELELEPMRGDDP